MKPLTHWAIYKGCKLRFRSRTPDSVTGIITGGDGVERAFTYAPDTLTIALGDETIRINDYGWEVERRQGL